MSLAEQIKNRIAQLLSNPNEGQVDVRPVAEKAGALPIYLDWSGCIAIRPDHSFVYYDWDEQSIKEEVEPQWQLLAIVSGSKKYPELKALTPQRTAEAQECRQCKGTGKGILEGQILERLICANCFGLGWEDEYIEKMSAKMRHS